jgi:N-acetylneuraminic acid mutarotase
MRAPLPADSPLTAVLVGMVWLLCFGLLPSAPAAGEDSAAGRWTAVSPAPSKRTEVVAASLDGKIYVMGGFTELSFSNLGSFTISDLVEVYDAATDKWKEAAALPAGLHHAAAAAIGGQLYVVGGFSKKLLSVWHPLATLYIYDPMSNAWTEGPPMPSPRGALAAVALDGKLYAIGGYDGNGNTGAVEVYDPATQRWAGRAPLPTPRDHLAAAVIDGRIYASGGRRDLDYHKNLAVTEVYESTADRWTKAPDLPTPRSGIAAGVVGKTLYVVGGEGPDGTFRNNEAFRPDLNQWQTMAAMPTGRHGLGAAVVQDRLYVLSGGPKPGGSFSNLTEVFDPPVRLDSDAPRGQKTSGAGEGVPRKRASAAQVGSVMAMLATFQDAGVLPPESSPEANQLIKALIQFQAAFMKSPDPAVGRVLDEALSAKLGPAAPEAIQRFHRQGWTSQSLEALVDHLADRPPWEDAPFARGRGAYNVGRQDFELLARIFTAARRALENRGQDLHRLYAARRSEMPGAKSN